MLKLVYCEILKLRRSKIVVFSFLGVSSTPFMMFIDAMQTHLNHPEKIFTLSDIYDSSLLYVMLLMNFMVYVAITAYLFSREYSENTLKTVLPSPLPRIRFVLGKYLMLLIWTTVLTVFTWITILLAMFIYNAFFGLAGFSLVIACRWLVKFMAGSILLYLTLSPFAYLAEKSKGFVIPVIMSAVVVMGSVAVSNQEIGALYPWTSGLFIITGKIFDTVYSIQLALGILASVSFVGFFSSFRYFCLEDLK